MACLLVVSRALSTPSLRSVEQAVPFATTVFPCRQGLNLLPFGAFALVWVHRMKEAPYRHHTKVESSGGIIGWECGPRQDEADLRRSGRTREPGLRLQCGWLCPACRRYG